MTSRFRRTAAGAALFAALTSFVAAHAGDIPAYQVLGCEKDCPSVTPAVKLTAPVPSFPDLRTTDDDGYIDGIADLDYTIGIDGRVKDIQVEDLLGLQAFADAAIAALNARTYTPATEGGKPVEQNARIRFVFEIPGEPNGARRQVINDYGLAVRTAKAGDLAGALKALNAIAARPAINLYERTMVALATAQYAAQSGDYAAARDAIRIATVERGAYLDQAAIEPAIRQRIRLEAANGDFAESFAWYTILRDEGYTRTDDPERDIVDKLRARIAAADPLVMPGVIPAGGHTTFWQHTLLRRSFEFHGVTGKLEKFEMHCQRHSILSPASEAADWTVPSSWGGCFINVMGTPGTKFQFVELQPASP